MGEEFLKILYDYLNSKKEKGQKVSGFGIIKFNPDKSKHLETATIKIEGQ